MSLVHRPLPEPPRWPGQPIRVATVPFRDPYVDAVLPDDVVRVGPSGEPSPWLEDWHLSAHAADVDVVHLHTGFDHLGRGGARSAGERPSGGPASPSS